MPNSPEGVVRGALDDMIREDKVAGGKHAGRRRYTPSAGQVGMTFGGTGSCSNW
jgi:hypothetical protein